MTREELQDLIDKGAKAKSQRPVVVFQEPPTGSNDWADKAMIAGLSLTNVDRMTAFWKADAEYLAPAFNHADTMAKALLEIAAILGSKLDAELNGGSTMVHIARSEARRLKELLAQTAP